MNCYGYQAECSLNLTEHFTIQEPKDPPIDDFFVVKKHRQAIFEAV